MGEQDEKKTPPPAPVSPPENAGEQSDFVVPELTVRKVEQHEQVITSLGNDLTTHKKRWGSPEEIANRLEEASVDSKKLDKLFSTIFVSMLKDERANPEVKEAVVGLIGKDDRHKFFAGMKKWGIIIGGVAVFFLGHIMSIITEVVKKKIGL